MKVVLENVEIPEGYEPTGEYRRAENESYFANLGEARFGTTISRVIILRKIPKWRDARLPEDAGKECRAANIPSTEVCVYGTLRGWDEGKYIITVKGNFTYQYCQVRDDA